MYRKEWQLCQSNCYCVYERKERNSIQTDVNLEKRFWSKVRKATPDKCWEWLGAKDRDGYGQFKVTISPGKAKQCKAHRVAFELFHGVESCGLCRHICDNPSCVNPNHLLEGTDQDNKNDMVNRGRSTKGRPTCIGEQTSSAKLTVSDVINIRKEAVKMSVINLAKKYKMHRSTIYCIINRKIWKHV